MTRILGIDLGTTSSALAVAGEETYAVEGIDRTVIAPAEVELSA